MTRVRMTGGKIEPYTWKGIASAAALSLAGIATELQGIRAVMEQQLGGPLADEGGGSGDDSGARDRDSRRVGSTTSSSTTEE